MLQTIRFVDVAVVFFSSSPGSRRLKRDAPLLLSPGSLQHGYCSSIQRPSEPNGGQRWSHDRRGSPPERGNRGTKRWFSVSGRQTEPPGSRSLRSSARKPLGSESARHVQPDLTGRTPATFKGFRKCELFHHSDPLEASDQRATNIYFVSSLISLLIYFPKKLFWLNKWV